MPRRAKPRPPHPANALLIGGGLAAVGTVPMPTGWYVIARTPARLYAPDRADPFPVAAGDRVRFEPVDPDAYAALERRAAAGEAVARREPYYRRGRALSPRLAILAAGPGVTLQDSGRHGYLRYGITAAGPMDPLAFATANRAAGNPAGATAIEVSAGGITVTAEDGPLGVVLASTGFRIALDGQALPPAVALSLEPGRALSVRAGSAGAWCYLAVCGRLDVPPMLGSTATHTRSGLGGLDGRALAAGDTLSVADPRPGAGNPQTLVAPWLNRPADVIRVVLGPQDDAFAPDQVRAFLDGPWTVGGRGDRMACFLDGPRLGHARGHDIVSDGIAMGAIQVPGEGLPIVLMADRQSTGGYPKIATVIGPDLGRLAQAQAGTRLRFTAVTIDDAVAARRSEAEHLRSDIRTEPVIRTAFPSELLLGLNLVDGVIDGRC